MKKDGQGKPVRFFEIEKDLVRNISRSINLRVPPECHLERERSQSDQTSRSFANGEYLRDLRRFLTRCLLKLHLIHNRQRKRKLSVGRG